MKYIASFILLFHSSMVVAQGVPHTFTAGTPARAAEVNENFADVDSRINGILADGQTLVSVVEKLFAEIDFLYMTGTAPGVSAALCPADSIPVAANCSCDGDGTSTNFGVLFACEIATDGAVAGCFPEALTVNFGIAEPTASVTATCISAILVDGTVATVFPIGGGASPDLQKTSTPTETTDEATTRLQNKVTVQRNAIQLHQ